MTRVTIYKHIENIPASDTVSDVCALWRVYGRGDNGGIRVGLEYGSRLEYFDDQEATRRARRAIDVRKLDIPFSAVSIEALQEESRQKWAELGASEGVDVNKPEVSEYAGLLKDIEQHFSGLDRRLFDVTVRSPTKQECEQTFGEGVEPPKALVAEVASAMGLEALRELAGLPPKMSAHGYHRIMCDNLGTLESRVAEEVAEPPPKKAAPAKPAAKVAKPTLKWVYHPWRRS